MTTRRGKSQARRHHGNPGLPGWAWMVLGVVLTIVVVLLAPKLLKSDGDGLWRPQPNPDAQPAPVAGGADDLPVPGSTDDDPTGAPAAPARPAQDSDGPEYDFYTLLPGKEVPLSDAELAATQRTEAQRLAQQQQARQEAQPASTDSGDATAALPKPVDGEPPAADTAATAPIIATSATAAGLGDGTRYLLQAGAFQASGQAEELKARIALLGLGARVESAQIQDKTVYRVRMGPYGTASDLAEAKRKLASGGLPAMAIKVK